jgi:hypothetical protein
MTVMIQQRVEPFRRTRKFPLGTGALNAVFADIPAVILRQQL